MPHATHSSNCIYLHWVRASAHAPLAYPFSTSTIASRLTDAVEQLLGNPLADEVRSFLESVADSLPAGACELHLPFISRKEIASASGILLAAYLHCDAPGIFRLVRKDQEFEDEFFRQCVTLMAASQFESAAMIPATICFTHKALAAAGAYLPWFPQLADAAGATKDRRRVVPASITVSLTERGQQAWRNTKCDHVGERVQLFAEVACCPGAARDLAVDAVKENRESDRKCGTIEVGRIGECALDPLRDGVVASSNVADGKQGRQHIHAAAWTPPRLILIHHPRRCVVGHQALSVAARTRSPAGGT